MYVFFPKLKGRIITEGHITQCHEILFFITIRKGMSRRGNLELLPRMKGM